MIYLPMTDQAQNKACQYAEGNLPLTGQSDKVMRGTKISANASLLD
jgi:hypothetical protein